MKSGCKRGVASQRDIQFNETSGPRFDSKLAVKPGVAAQSVVIQGKFYCTWNKHWKWPLSIKVEQRVGL